MRLKGFDYSDPDAVFFVTIRAAKDTYPFVDPDTAGTAVGLGGSA